MRRLLSHVALVFAANLQFTTQALTLLGFLSINAGFGVCRFSWN